MASSEIPAYDLPAYARTAGEAFAPHHGRPAALDYVKGTAD